MWVGGLVTLVLLRPVLRGGALATVVSRFSGLALAAVVVVSVSGVLNASTRLDGPADLASRYGLLVLAKVALVAVLAAAGWWHRRSLLPALAAGRAVFWRLVTGELLVMAVTVGVAVALSGTSPPVSDSEAPDTWSTAEVLIGSSMPPGADPRPARSRCGARTCCGSWSPSVSPRPTCSASAACTGAATAGRSGGRCSGCPGWPWSSSSRAPGWPPTAGCCSAPTCCST